MVNSVVFRSSSVEWSTPQGFFDLLNKEFNFTLDACASSSNHKCVKYYTLLDDGLSQDWSNETVWLNPPYGRGVGKWLEKLYKSNVVGVALIPARTDTRYFHDWVVGKCEVRFVKGRLKFGDSKNSAPFASLLLVYSPRAPN